MNIKRKKKNSSNPAPALLCVALKMGYLKKKSKKKKYWAIFIITFIRPGVENETEAEDGTSSETQQASIAAPAGKNHGSAAVMLQA